MSATIPTRGRPRRCPCCGRTYAFRLKNRLDDGFGVGRYHRHHGPRAHVYFHEIVYWPSDESGTHEVPIDADALHALLVA